MDYKKAILEQIKTLTYGEAMKEINRHISNIRNGWDSIICEKGKYYQYDYARKHSYGEEYGEEIKGDELKRYKALEEVYNGLFSGEIEAGVNKTINI